jgi:hypothetical protein
MLKRAAIPALLLLLGSAPQAPESWPGYEGRLHQSASAVDIDPAGLSVLWTRRFATMVPVNEARIWGDHGTMSSRNLVALGGKITLAATVDAAVPANRACVTVLDAGTGGVLNCVRTEQRLGPYKNMLDATDTAMGEQILGWDPDTGILFLSIGGDQASRTASLPLANQATFAGAAQTAKPAYQDLVAAFPGIRSARRINEGDPADPGRRRAEERDPSTGGFGMPPDQWDIGSMFGEGPNMCGFFDVQAGSSYMPLAKNLGHDGSSGIMLVNKHTGLAASGDWNQSFNTYLGWTAFKMWNGALVDGDKVYYMGPYDPAVPGNDPAAGGVQKGLRLGCLRYADENRHPLDGGYTGPGRDESAVMISRPFDYARSSIAVGSWKEADNTYRNKAMMVQGDGVWAAWKPSPAGTVELVRATPTVNQAHSLSVGAGMRGQDIWPNLAFAAGRYVVYALFNARPSAGVAPVGPSTLTVFDTVTGTEKWSVALTYPTLRPNSHELYFEVARLVVAGNHAYVAWVDTQTGRNLTLQVAGFDVTATAPAGLPVPFTVDLGVALGGNLESRVTDLIAIDGTLVALVSESPDLLRNGHIHAQQVVAISSSGGGPAPAPGPGPAPPPGGGQGDGGGGGGCGLLGIDLAWITLALRRWRAAR